MKKVLHSLEGISQRDVLGRPRITKKCVYRNGKNLEDVPSLQHKINMLKKELSKYPEVRTEYYVVIFGKERIISENERFHYEAAGITIHSREIEYYKYKR